jgi:poly(A) polymerase
MELPTEHELKLNEEMLEELKRQNNFETPEGVERRKRVLDHFHKLAREFVKLIAQRKNFPQSVQDSSGGLITTYGSYRLGVINPGSDIDTLFVAPKHVTRDDFMDGFPDFLKKKSPERSVEECVVVKEAFVPILKIVYESIDVDLIFVALKQSSVPDNIDLKDNNLLRGLDDTDLRSINGVRVTDEILSVVPQQKAFRNALRAIKLWAQRHAVYSNISGFPGGVAWAMMVARVCQLYPMATSSVIVGKTLDLIARWNWPRPIQLKQYAKGPLEVREWNPSVCPHLYQYLLY